MKKSLLVSCLLAVSAMGAQAATTYFHDLSQTTTVNGLTFTRVVDGYSTITTSDNSANPLYTAYTSNQAATTVSFTFDLTALKENYDGNTTMAGVLFKRSNDSTINGASISIYRSSAGKYEAWVSTMTEAGVSTTIATKCIDSDIVADFTANGREYATFSLITGPIKNNTLNVGFVGADAQGNLTWASDYQTAHNQEITKVLLNTDYVTSAAITPYYVTDATTLTNISRNIPEPATATLSLLALAGLAARRRRK